MADKEKIEQIVKTYCDSVLFKRPEDMVAIFHENAIMSGSMNGQIYISSPDEYVKMIENLEKPLKEMGIPYEVNITDMTISGDAASVVVDEKNLGEENYTTFFHMLKIKGEWKIVSKCYQMY